MSVSPLKMLCFLTLFHFMLKSCQDTELIKFKKIEKLPIFLRSLKNGKCSVVPILFMKQIQLRIISF